MNYRLGGNEDGAGDQALLTRPSHLGHATAGVEPVGGQSGCGATTYAELKRRYPTNAPGSPWYSFPDVELEADLRFAAALAMLTARRPESRGGRVIEAWITHELDGRRRHTGTADDTALSRAA